MTVSSNESLHYKFIIHFGGERILKIGEYLAKFQARAWFSRALCAPG